MMGKTIHYFAAGHTARGYFNLYESNLRNLDHLFVLWGRPLSLFSGWLEDMASKWNAKGCKVEVLHSPWDAAALTGVILPAFKIALVDANELRGLNPESLAAKVRYVNLTQAQQTPALTAEHELLKCSLGMRQALQAAYNCFGEALCIHDKWEEIYICNMDFKAADRLADSYAKNILGNAVFARTSCAKHRFLGAATPQGSVDFVPSLTQDIARRYFLKGRPGTGKSTLLKRIVVQAEKKGRDVEVYHCGFDPNSLDMVIIRDLNTAILDSTAPHEYFPARAGDEIIDLYQILIKPGTDTLHADALGEISSQYKEKIRDATALLAQAKLSRDAMDEVYRSLTDIRFVTGLLQSVADEIQALLP